MIKDVSIKYFSFINFTHLNIHQLLPTNPEELQNQVLLLFQEMSIEYHFYVNQF